MTPAKKQAPEFDDQHEGKAEQLVNVEDRRIQNMVKLLIMMLLTYIVIFM